MSTADVQSQGIVRRTVIRVGRPLRRWLTAARSAESRLNVRLKTFNNLKSLSDDDRAKIESFVVHHEARATRFEARSAIYFPAAGGIVGGIIGYLLADVLASMNIILVYITLYLAVIPILIAKYLIRMRWFTDSYLVDSLLLLIQFIEDNEDRWLQLRFRRQVIGKLERIGRIVERDIRRALRGRDRITKQWIRERTWKTAAGIRDLKTWLVIPRPLTREDLLGTKLVPTFVAAATGDWDNMEKAHDRERPGDDSRWIRFVSKALAVTGNVIALALLAVSIYIQTDKGKEFLSNAGVTGSVATGLTTVISSIAAAFLLYLAQSGKTKLIGEEEAKKAADVVVGPGEASKGS